MPNTVKTDIFYGDTRDAEESYGCPYETWIVTSDGEILFCDNYGFGSNYYQPTEVNVESIMHLVHTELTFDPVATQTVLLYLHHEEPCLPQFLIFDAQDHVTSRSCI